MVTVDRILVIDDDVELCTLVGEYLAPEGFLVECAHDGKRGLEAAVTGEHLLVVLDVMLPGMNGFDVLRRIRGKSRVPVLLLTARGEDVDRIVGLEIGADDYLPKPFNPRELVARIHAILRRVERRGAGVGASQESRAPERMEVGDVEVDTGTRVVRRAGDTVELTNVEYEILVMLLTSAGRVVTREDLVRTVLGREMSVFDRSIDMHISHLRKKLGHRVGEAERIRTVRGVGYVYARPTEADKSEGASAPTLAD